MWRQQSFLSREQIAGRYHKKINGEKTNLKIAPFPKSRVGAEQDGEPLLILRGVACL